jgi:hypothetical protein
MFETVYGVDFSGAKLAGRNIWVARLEPGEGNGNGHPHQLAELSCLEKLCGTAERAPALAHLVRRIADSQQALWALDFPFGLPIEVMEPGATWSAQFDFLRGWGEDAYGAGLECLRRARELGGPNHIRRLTDSEEKALFDCYHYRGVSASGNAVNLVKNAVCGIAQIAWKARMGTDLVGFGNGNGAGGSRSRPPSDRGRRPGGADNPGLRPPTFERFYGVDFSGAKRAGDAIWVAGLAPCPAAPASPSPPCGR